MALTHKKVWELNPGDRVFTNSGFATVEKVIHDTPNFPEIRIQFEGAIARTARLDYLPTESVVIE